MSLNPFALLSSLSKVLLSYPFSVLILKIPFTMVILFVAVKASSRHSMLKFPSFINIFPIFLLSVSSGEHFIASAPAFIVYVPLLNSKYPSVAMAVALALIIYSPPELSKIIDTLSPPLILFLIYIYSFLYY